MNKQRDREHCLAVLKNASQKLAKLSFSPLGRPNVPRDAPPTRELVDWAIRMYCFSMLSHYREMLRSFLLLTESGNIPAAFVTSRCLFEMGAHAYYVNKHVQQYLKVRNLVSAWEFLWEINMGSRYMEERITDGGTEYDGPAVRTPREIAKVIRCFNEYGKIRMAAETYSFLSEFAHPNMGAFSHYYEWKVDESKIAKVTFTGAPREPTKAPLTEVSISLVSALMFSQKLLAEAGETEVAPKVKEIVLEHITLEEQ